MKALVVLSAVIAVVLSATSVDKRYVRPGAYVPWQQQSRYYNAYNPVRNVYQSPRWYQPTIKPVKYEASTLSPWLTQGKAKFSFGSAVTVAPAVSGQPQAEQKITIVEAAPAVPKVPVGFGAFHFGKKSNAVEVTKEENKPIVVITPEIKITETNVQSSSSAEASLKSISNEESVQAQKNVVVAVPEEIKPVLIETVSVQSAPEIKLSTEALVQDLNKIDVKSVEIAKKLNLEESNENINKTSLAIEKSNIQLAEAKPALVEELKPLSIIENQSISEIKSEAISPVVLKKKHGFSFSYNPSSNVYNKNELTLYPQVQPSAATVNEINVQPISIETIQPVELNPTLQPIFESEKETIAPASSTIEPLEATTENILQNNEFVVPTIDISQPIIQYNQYISVPSKVYAVSPLTAEQVLPTADISQPIIQYASLSEETESTTVVSDQTTTESSSATSDYSQYSLINSESIDVLLSTQEATTEAQAEIEQEKYTSTESESSTTESAPVTTESGSNEYLQNDFEPAPTTVQSQQANIESIPAIDSSAPLVPEPLAASIQPESVAVISSQSFSYSSTPSIVKKKHGFSFSYNPSENIYNKEAVYKPDDEPAALEIKVAPAVTTSAPSIVEYKQPLISAVVPASNIWSNSYNVKKNSFSFSYNPSVSYFNKQPYYQPQVVVAPAPSAAVLLSSPSATPVTSSPAVSSTYIEIATESIESTPTAPQYEESTTILLENSSEDAQAITTESSLPETTIVNIEYGTTESEEKASIEPELPSTTAEPILDLGSQLTIVESSNVAAESLPSKVQPCGTPALLASSFAVPPVAPQVLPAANAWSNAYNAKKNAFSFSYVPSTNYFYNPVYQPQVAQIAPASASYASPVEPLPNLSQASAAAIEISSPEIEISAISTESAPEIEVSSTAINEIATENAELVYSTTEFYSDKSTTLAIESDESFSTTQTAPASYDSVPAAIELSVKENLNEQLAIALIPKETVPIVIETSAAIKSENVTQSSSAIKSSPVILESASASAISSPVLIESAPAAAASIQAIPVPLYVKEETKISPPASFQPSYVTKKHGFSFSYKPSGNYYKKPELIASVAPAIVESSPAITSVAPTIVESAPEIASIAPVNVESSPVITSVAPAIIETSAIASVAPTLVESSQEDATGHSILLSIFNAVKSAILEEESTEKLIEAKPEIALNPSAVSASQELNLVADVSSSNDIAVKVSPKSSELKEEVQIIHDLRLGN